MSASSGAPRVSRHTGQAGRGPAVPLQGCTCRQAAGRDGEGCLHRSAAASSFPGRRDGPESAALPPSLPSAALQSSGQPVVTAAVQGVLLQAPARQGLLCAHPIAAALLPARRGSGCSAHGVGGGARSGPGGAERARLGPSGPRVTGHGRVPLAAPVTGHCSTSQAGLMASGVCTHTLF